LKIADLFPVTSEIIKAHHFDFSDLAIFAVAMATRMTTVLALKAELLA
jgi:hypothetical protein